MKNDRIEDQDPRTSLAFLDPQSGDPGYWERFKHQVLVLAGPELARRRAVRPVTVSDVVMGWRNALVPTALLAAAVAGLLLMQGRPLVQTAPIGVEELLVSGLEEPIPAMFAGGLTPEAGRVSHEESF